MAPETPPLLIHKASHKYSAPQVSPHLTFTEYSSGPAKACQTSDSLSNHAAMQVWRGKRSEWSEEILSAARLMPKYRRW